MKKITIFLVAILFAVAAVAQDYSEIKSSQLPKKATEFINTDFKGATITRAAKSTDKDTKYVAVISIKDRKSILVFDKNGEFLTRARNMEEVKNMSSVKSNPKPTPAAKPPANNPNTDPPKSR